MNVSCSSKGICYRQFRSLFSIIIVELQNGKNTHQISAQMLFIEKLLYNFSVPVFFRIKIGMRDMKVASPVRST